MRRFVVHTVILDKGLTPAAPSPGPEWSSGIRFVPFTVEVGQVLEAILNFFLKGSLKEVAFPKTFT